MKGYFPAMISRRKDGVFCLFGSDCDSSHGIYAYVKEADLPQWFGGVEAAKVAALKPGQCMTVRLAPQLGPVTAQEIEDGELLHGELVQ